MATQEVEAEVVFDKYGAPRQKICPVRMVCFALCGASVLNIIVTVGILSMLSRWCFLFQTNILRRKIFSWGLHECCNHFHWNLGTRLLNLASRCDELVSDCQVAHLILQQRARVGPEFQVSCPK